MELVLRRACLDFPEKFGNFGPKVMGFLTSNDPNLTMGGLLAMRQLCREMDQTRMGDRQLLFDIVAQVFPLLYKLLSHIQQYDAPDSVEMQLTIVKTMWSACAVTLPPYFADPSTHAQWMEIVFNLMNRPEPAYLAALEPAPRARSAFWRVKKWIGFFFRRQLNRYSRISRGHDQSPNGIFAPIWMNTYSVPTMNCLLSILDHKRRGAFVVDRLVSVIVDFLNVAIMPAVTWLAMLPILPQLVREILFPLVCFSQQDWVRFQQDPPEWIRMQLGDADEDVWGPQYVTSFLHNLVRFRTKDFLISLMNFIVNEVMQPIADVPPQQRTAEMLSRKFGCLDIIAHLHGTIKRSKAMKPHLEQILLTHVLPELNSDALFLRAKACQVFSVYYDIDFTSAQTFVTGVELVLQNVPHSNENVAALAAVGLHLLVRSNLSRELIKRVLPNVIDVVFQLVDSLDNESIVKTLESLIACFPEEIVPRAVDAVSRLAEHYHRLVQLARSDENDDISVTTALQVGGAIATLLDACAKSPAAYPLLEPFVIPICQMVLQQEMTEYLDEVLKMLIFLSLHEEPVSAQVWSCFPEICRMLTTWAADYMSESLAIFDNLISRSTEKFLTSGALDMAINIFNAYVADPKRSEYAAGNASQIMEVIFVYCRGRVDHVVPHAITTALQRFTIAKTESLRILCLEVVANAIIYNPVLALTYIEQQGYTIELFNQLLNAAVPPPKKSKKKKGKPRKIEPSVPSPFSRLHDKQVAIMAFSSILTIPISTLPASIQQFLPRVLVAVLKLQDEFEVQKVLKDAQEEEEEEEEDSGHPDADAPADTVDLMQKGNDKFAFSQPDDEDLEEADEEAEEFEDWDGEDEEGNYDYADNVDAEDTNERYADMIMERLATAHEEEFDFDDDDSFSSQLDSVDPVIFFIDIMHAMTQRDGVAAQQLIASLSEQQQKLLNGLDAEATKRKLAAQSGGQNQ